MVRCVRMLFLSLLLISGSCSVSSRVDGIRKNKEVFVAVEDENRQDADDTVPTDADVLYGGLQVSDSSGENEADSGILLDGEKYYLIENGENIGPSVIQAHASYVAERDGYANINFRIIAPAALQKPQWQIRFRPCLDMDGDTLDIEDLVLTGVKYKDRREEKDSLDLLYGNRQLEGFLYRNIPDVMNSDYITGNRNPDICTGTYGVSYWEAKDFFLGNGYLTIPPEEDAVLAEILVDGKSDYKYDYEYHLSVQNDIRQVKLFIIMDIYRYGKCIYSSRVGQELTYYVSNLLYFADFSQQFYHDVSYSRVSYDYSSDIRFRQGKHEIEACLGKNEAELNSLRARIDELMSSEDFIMDSIVVTASCSPEGSLSTNERLARERSVSMTGYISSYVRSRYGDSVAGDMDFISRYIPEDWNRLRRLVVMDDMIQDKDGVLSLWKYDDLDFRADRLAALEDYKRIYEEHFPVLREVRTSFHMHDRRMERDTIVSEDLNRRYMEGLGLLSRKDYAAALMILEPYNDINTAVCLLALGHDASASSVLRSLPPSPARDYLLAMACSRTGEDESALSFLESAISQDRSLYFRTSLDPELKRIVDKYEIRY